MLNSKIKQNIKNYIPLIIFILGITFYHFTINPNTYLWGDYTFFNEISKNMSLFEFLSLRYKTWTSRLLIEASLYFIAMLPRLSFIIFHIIVVGLLAFILLKLLNDDNSYLLNTVIVALLFLFNIQSMVSAGWIPTLTNYMYPLLFFILSLFPIKNYLLGNKYPNWHCVFYSLYLIIACNNEQIGVCLFVIYLFLLIYMIIKKDIDKKIYIFISLIILSLLFIITCPGNHYRVINESKTHYQEFENFNIIQKILNSAGTILYFLLGNTSSIFVNKLLIIFLLFTAIYICFIYKNIFVKISSFIPFIIIFILTFSFGSGIFDSIFNLFTIESIKYNVTNLNIKSFYMFLCFIVFVLLILYNLILIFIKEYKKKFSLILPLVFCVGFLSIIVIGFSPTSFASNTRTFIFFQFANIICITNLFMKINKYNKKLGLILICLLIILSVISFTIELLFLV